MHFHTICNCSCLCYVSSIKLYPKSFRSTICCMDLHINVIMDSLLWERNANILSNSKANCFGVNVLGIDVNTIITTRAWLFTLKWFFLSCRYGLSFENSSCRSGTISQSAVVVVSKLLPKVRQTASLVETENFDGISHISPKCSRERFTFNSEHIGHNLAVTIIGKIKKTIIGDTIGIAMLYFVFFECCIFFR